MRRSPSILNITLAIALANFCAGVSAASTVTSVTCASPGVSLGTGTTICDAQGTNGYASAGANAVVILPTSASGPAMVDATSTATSLETTSHGFTAIATATSSDDISIIFDTVGPVRNGLLELNFAQNTWTHSANAILHESLAIGSYSTNPNGSNLASVWIPIQLGKNFGFNYVQSILAISDAFTGMTTADIDSQISLLAFEANGSTPVQLYDPPGSPTFTPEPASLGMIVAGALLGVAAFLRRRR